ncbi:MAG: hypothetical protein GYB65_15780 [Chloroflexi bacterium]|nr:hypothetical protein [Chloroflexota bacterium]
MHPTISECLDILRSQSAEKDQKQTAIIIIAFSLEKSNVIRTPFDYTDYLPPTLLNHRHSEVEQGEIVLALLQIFEDGPYVETGIFWAIGKALPCVNVCNLSPFFAKHWHEWGDSLLRSAIESLGRGLVDSYWDNDEQPVPEITSVLCETRLRECMQAILQRDYLHDDDVYYVADRILGQIELHHKPEDDA